MARPCHVARVPLVTLEDVSVHYGALEALRGVSLSLQKGRIGLLGPNGAGKSTLLKVLLGMVRPSHGRATVLDLDVAEAPLRVRQRVGYMPEAGGLLPESSAFEYVRFAAELAGLPRAEATGRAHQVLHWVGLGEARYRALGGFSTGMKQRARLAAALVGDPDLLLLDEPTSGLDPRGREEMLDLVREIPEKSRASVLLSTHILPDVEKTCDHVLVLSEGRVRYDGTLQDLLGTEHRRVWVRVRGSQEPLRLVLEKHGCTVRPEGGGLDVRLPPGEGPETVVRLAAEEGLQVRHLEPYRATLERAFAQAVGRAAGDTSSRLEQAS